MRTFMLRVLVLLLAGVALGCMPRVAMAVEHPFILWNKEDIAALRQRLENDEWAKEAYANLKANPGMEAPLVDLLTYAVYQDEDAAQRQVKKLMQTVNSPAPWGGAQWLNVLRYDVLYDKLTPEERAKTEQVFRIYIDTTLFTNAVKDVTDGFTEQSNNRYSRYDSYLYSRSNWLPNIVFPRRINANLMAVALGDEALIRKAWSAYGSWQWYLDEYLADSGFYGEEFGKMGSTPGEELLYCRGLQRLGLNELGFGYVGRNGATMRGHIESLIRLGYPRVDVGSSRPDYPMLTMGDLRRGWSAQRDNPGTFAFQHSIAAAYLPNGKGGPKYFQAPGAWGGEVRPANSIWDGYGNFTPKMQLPLWFEFAAQQWPDAGFDYFLAQMRGLEQDKYYPTLYSGLTPIDPATVKAPRACSYVAPQRGIAMLRHDESPAYWESSAPAAGLRLAAPYAHSTNDAFSLVGFFAFNRPIYLDREVTNGYAAGWSRSVLSHNSVMVDGKEPGFTEAVMTRHGFFPEVKFVAAQTAKVFPGIDMTRGLFLTKDYLLDLFHLSGADGQPHQYLWLVHTLGEGSLTAPGRTAQTVTLDGQLAPFVAGRRIAAGDTPWSMTAVQTCGLPDPGKAILPQSWYDRKVGVRLSMLGASGTTVTLARTPVADDPAKAPAVESAPALYEAGGASVLVNRNAARTTFAALHEPFEQANPRIKSFARLAEGDDYIAVKIGGPTDVVNDRVFIRFSDDRTPVTVTDGDEQFVAGNYGFVRVVGAQVQAFGDIRSLKVKAPADNAIFTLNGRRTKSEVKDGFLTFTSEKQ